MDCNECHSEVDLEDRFCGFCGSFLKRQRRDVVVAQKYQIGNNKDGERKNNSYSESWTQDVSRIPVIGSSLRGVGILSTALLIVVFITLMFLRVGESAKNGDSSTFGGLIFFIIIIIGFFVYVWFSATAPERAVRKEKDRVKRLEKERADQKEKERQKKQKESEWKRVRSEEISQYRELRKDIESMTMYQTWRKQVFEKFGRQCQGCPRIEGLEIHHSKSLYSILKNHRIKNKYRALECKDLWDVDNGLVLCHECHEYMESSKVHKKLL